jgi:hypothetical protein
MKMEKEIIWSFNSLLIEKKTMLVVFFLFVSFSLFAQSKIASLPSPSWAKDLIIYEVNTINLLKQILSIL